MKQNSPITNPPPIALGISPKPSNAKTTSKATETPLATQVIQVLVLTPPEDSAQSMKRSSPWVSRRDAINDSPRTRSSSPNSGTSDSSATAA
ncbi:MAG: hypothetical protein R3B96_08305 [Pirellulaceae bacterium]